MSNRKRLKKLILANKETRCLYRMMQLLAIFMIVSCLVIIATAKWIEYDQNKKREELFGSWDEVFLNVDQDDLNYFRKNAFLEQISVQSIQEKVFLEGDQRVVIGACDENFLEMGNIELLEGRMPEHEKEVAIEEEYLEILDVSGVGDVVPGDSKVISLRDYKITGIFENYSRCWKFLNKKINFPNCIVISEKLEHINVFVEYSIWAKKDPEINQINYEDNISKFDINENILVAKLISPYFLVILITIYKIIRNIPIANLDAKNGRFFSLRKEKLNFKGLIQMFLNIFLVLIIFKCIEDLFLEKIDENLFRNMNDILLASDMKISLLGEMIKVLWLDGNVINQTSHYLMIHVIYCFLAILNIVMLLVVLFITISYKKASVYQDVNNRKQMYYIYDYYQMNIPEPRKKDKISVFIEIILEITLISIIYTFKYNLVGLKAIKIVVRIFLFTILINLMLEITERYMRNHIYRKSLKGS